MSVEDDEESAYTLLERGKGLLESGNPAKAVVLLQRALVAEPRKGSILEMLGRAEYSCGRYQAASVRFEDALEVDPTNDYAHYCLGLCCLKTKSGRKAGGHFKLAWQLSPKEMYSEMAARFGA
ncbi:MAG: tetratricopeptide repeat protein [Actinobacteria bacterium]|nr:tetratricopeptide repeat protein [Actinomycetota bacterium]MCG2820073.1 tetratricopeptide repeat protein [Actinomycetes bacterium]MBU4179164.1 tetratricopeptide repeat protein [Actinomycetota bacterium]MBU4218972.1 tetratricopeptide repeat protein [Actinomycetota bacterium]MBU4359160.1 tetratricopeptide repeat protein [Actinomycetota bacterium]